MSIADCTEEQINEITDKIIKRLEGLEKERTGNDMAGKGEGRSVKTMTEKERQRMCDLYNQGMESPDIARKLGFSVKSMGSLILRLKKEGRLGERKTLKPSAPTDKEVSESWDIKQSVVPDTEHIAELEGLCKELMQDKQRLSDTVEDLEEQLLEKDKTLTELCSIRESSKIEQLRKSLQGALSEVEKLSRINDDLILDRDALVLIMSRLVVERKSI